MDAKQHYDKLIEENDDPVLDPPALKAYMDKWDGELFLSLLDTDGRSALEIGVGTGRLALKIAKRCKAFTGIDLSEKTLARAREHLAAYVPKLLCGDFLDYPFSERFDLIYSSLTFMHIQDKLGAVQKAYALLTGGGRFVLSIDKDKRDELVCGKRRIRLFPDDEERTKAYFQEAGFARTSVYQTEFAYIFLGEK